MLKVLKLRFLRWLLRKLAAPKPRVADTFSLHTEIEELSVARCIKMILPISTDHVLEHDMVRWGQYDLMCTKVSHVDNVSTHLMMNYQMDEFIDRMRDVPPLAN